MHETNLVKPDKTAIDEIAIRQYRLDRVRRLSEQDDISAILLFDPVNIRYSNGSRNMQVWSSGLTGQE
jgi:Xaa-Pro dipeptidase